MIPLMPVIFNLNAVMVVTQMMFVMLFMLTLRVILIMEFIALQITDMLFMLLAPTAKIIFPATSASEQRLR